MIENNTVCISHNQLRGHKHPNTLVLPPQIRKVTSCASGSLTVPPLHELCLAFIWRCTKPSSSVYEGGSNCGDLTPQVILKRFLNLLEVGPVSWCNNLECHSPIFTFVSILVVTITVAPKVNAEVTRMPMIMYFCSDACAYNFTQSLDGQRDSFSKWLSEKLKKPYCIEVM